MHISDHFSLPYTGMKDGLHKYTFVAGDEFLSHFPDSPIQKGDFTIRVSVDKRPGLSDLNFDISGRMATACDRCTADIQLPVYGSYQLVVKTGQENADDVEVIYIREDQPTLDLTQVIYEFICLSIPMVRVYACEDENPKVCNQEVLSKLQTPGDDSESGMRGSLWDAFMDISDE